MERQSPLLCKHEAPRGIERSGDLTNQGLSKGRSSMQRRPGAQQLDSLWGHEGMVERAASNALVSFVPRLKKAARSHELGGVRWSCTDSGGADGGARVKGLEPQPIEPIGVQP